MNIILRPNVIIALLLAAVVLLVLATAAHACIPHDCHSENNTEWCKC